LDVLVFIDSSSFLSSVHGCQMGCTDYASLASFCNNDQSVERLSKVMIFALKVLCLVAWFCICSYAIQLMMGGIFPKLKLKYSDYISLLGIFMLLVSFAKMIWELSL
jgi:hypothetical protein